MNAIEKQVQEMEASIKSHKEEMNRRMTSIEKKISNLRTENSIPLTTESTEEDKITFAEQMQAIEKSNEDRTRRIVELESAVKQLQEKEDMRKNQVKLRLFAFFLKNIVKINLFLIKDIIQRRKILQNQRKILQFLFKNLDPWHSKHLQLRTFCCQDSLVQSYSNIILSRLLQHC